MPVVQIFRPENVDLAPYSAGSMGSASPDGPEMRAATAIESGDGTLTSGIWESAAGRQRFRHSTDEFVHILEGEVWVTAAGETFHLRAGDVALFPAGLEMEWDVPEHVRKVWVHRRLPLPRRLAVRVTEAVAGRRQVKVGVGAGMAGGAAAVGWAVVQVVG